MRVRVAGLGMLGHWVTWGYKMPCNLVHLSLAEWNKRSQHTGRSAAGAFVAMSRVVVIVGRSSVPIGVGEGLEVPLIAGVHVRHKVLEDEASASWTEAREMTMSARMSKPTWNSQFAHLH